MLAEDAIGSVEAGKCADLTLYDNGGAAWAPGHDLVRTMVYSVDGRSVDRVLVDGRVVYEDGAPAGYDARDVVDQAREVGARVASRLGLDARPRWKTVEADER